MFPLESSSSETPTGVPADTAALAAIIARLRDHGCTGDGDPERITQIELLETLKHVAEGVQAVLTADFARSRETELARIATESVRDRARRDVAAQIGLARRVSPHRGTQLVGVAKILTTEMPHLLGALRRGALDEYQATLVVAETATLSREHRQTVDTELAGRFGSMTPARAQAEAARIGYRLDPEQAVTRLRKGHSDRRVTLRPAPDTMSYLTALLPATEGVAVLAALTRHAATAKAAGDKRGTGALMADELVTRLKQPATAGGASITEIRAVDIDTAAAGTADASPGSRVRVGGTENATQDIGLEDVDYLDAQLPAAPTGVNIEIQLIMTDRTLLDGDMEPALPTGYGPIPAPLARHLARGAGPDTITWIRRLYTDPHTGQLAGGDQRRRLFSHVQRQFLIARDQVCRTPWCDAPIRPADHTQPHTAGGPTDTTNGAGLCAACNQTKEHPGWRSETRHDGGILITTPTGHQYLSQPPRAPRSEPWETLVA